jgi:hypothetical protein
MPRTIAITGKFTGGKTWTYAPSTLKMARKACLQPELTTTCSDFAIEKSLD